MGGETKEGNYRELVFSEHQYILYIVRTSYCCTYTTLHTYWKIARGSGSRTPSSVPNLPHVCGLAVSSRSLRRSFLITPYSILRAPRIMMSESEQRSRHYSRLVSFVLSPFSFRHTVHNIAPIDRLVFSPFQLVRSTDCISLSSYIWTEYSVCCTLCTYMHNSSRYGE